MVKRFKDFPEDRKIYWYAKFWLDLLEEPPQEYREKVLQYILNHQEELRNPLEIPHDD